MHQLSEQKIGDGFEFEQISFVREYQEQKDSGKGHALVSLIANATYFQRNLIPLEYVRFLC